MMFAKIEFNNGTLVWFAVSHIVNVSVSKTGPNHGNEDQSFPGHRYVTVKCTNGQWWRGWVTLKRSRKFLSTLEPARKDAGE